MAGADLIRRIERVFGYPPLCDMDEVQRREFHEALLDASSFEDLSGKWQAAILQAEQNRAEAARRMKCRVTYEKPVPGPAAPTPPTPTTPGPVPGSPPDPRP